MTTLFHFPPSPFSRRVRLALALKGIVPELRNGREDPVAMAEALRHSPLGTMPVLVDGDVSLGDSLAILQWLDVRIPDPPIWPRDPKLHAEAQLVVTSMDRALDLLVEYGTRIFGLASHEAWPAARDKALGRIRGSVDVVAAKAQGREGQPLVGDTWGAADLVVYTAAAWYRGLPARAPTFAPAGQILSLGVEMPAAITAWADSHASRPDIRALDAI